MSQGCNFVPSTHQDYACVTCANPDVAHLHFPRIRPTKLPAMSRRLVAATACYSYVLSVEAAPANFHPCANS